VRAIGFVYILRQLSPTPSKTLDKLAVTITPSP